MAWSAIKRRQLEDDFGSFEFQFQTQKRIRSSRVSETQRNVAVEEKSTVGLPLREGLASSATKNAEQNQKIWVLMKSVRPRRGRGLLGFLRPNGM
ncbi:unnamed protein product [Prunus armeniaca]|uniref:Uncharacterized protein n=1 Tax=Prunus armeniaca TaxID=36596 RepID=A0A6J5VPG3_PRUAR|nr:unnamed protein product [Prunus armeniaca]